MAKGTSRGGVLLTPHDLLTNGKGMSASSGNGEGNQHNGVLQAGRQAGEEDHKHYKGS